MFTSPRVIAIDDELRHLAGLADGLNRHGVACLQIHYTADQTDIKPCPDVRIIFADLHLLESGLVLDHKRHFDVIRRLLDDTIKPSGPYFILLWTQYPDQAPALREFLERLQDATKPFAVLPLAKVEHLDAEGKVKDELKLIKAIDTLTEMLPQIGALFDWESRVLKATGKTVSSILDLASMQEADTRAREVGRILARLAIATVGKPHVDSDRFRAVNEALLPILADRIANLHGDDNENELWQETFHVGPSLPPLSMEKASKLNQLVHIADPGNAKGTDRGVVVLLPGCFQENFTSTFGLDENDAALRQFHCKDFALDDHCTRWVLVQAQAACDHAQNQPGPAPFYLGLDLPKTCEPTGRKAPASLWRSPAFEFDGEVRLLHVSARFPISLPSNVAQEASPCYRLREQVLNNLIFRLHSYSARPGMISFRSR